MMAVSAGLSGGVLTVNSNDAADAVNFKQTSGKISINGVSGSWSATKVKSVVVNLNGGDDSVSLNSFANGGNQMLAENVTVRGGLGNEVAHLANGQDVHFSGVGNTLYVGSNGAAYMNGATLNFGNTIQTSLSNGVLTVTATNANDSLKFLQSNGWFGLQGGTIGWWQASAVNSVVVRLQEGDDYVSLDSLANGGQEAFSKLFTVHSGEGDQSAHLASGDDVDFSGWGHVLSVPAAGSATLDGQPVSTVDEVQASFSNGVLTVTGKNGDDNLKFLESNGWFGLQGGVIGWFSTASVTSVVVNLRGGNDYVSLDSLSNGGGQALSETFTINSGAGNETVHLANGEDVAFSGAGHQLVANASGTVTLDGQVLFDDDPPPPPPPPPPTNWFDTHITDAALRALGHDLYLDNLIDRNDMLALLNNVKDGGVIDGTELTDLRSVVAASSLFGSLAHVQELADYIANGTAANAKYQGAALGNLAAGSSSTQLDKLVNKWFFGLDRPNAQDPYGMFSSYRQFAGQLFVSGAAYDDIKQGSVGDCYFVMALAETALRSNSTITNMFIVNGDGTYTVKFYGAAGVHYVTVDSYLPTNAGGSLFYASRWLNYTNTGGELWVALAEKAYAQLNEFGWSRPGSYSGQNTYSALSGGYIYAALGHVTGQSTSAFTMTSSGSSFTTFVNAWNAGKSIGFASYSSPPSGSGVVGGHAYAVVGYNAGNQTVTLFNPWGTDQNQAPPHLTLTWAQIQQYFQYFDRTV